MATPQTETAKFDISNFVQQIAPDSLGLFVGSGLSLAAGHPSWTESVVRAVTFALPLAQDDDMREALKLAAKKFPPPTFFELLKKALSPTDYLDVLVKAFASDGPNEPTPLLTRLVESDWRIIVTTNYDDLLERAIKKSLRVDPVVALPEADGIARVRSGRDRVIFKIHGTIARPETMIVADSDYSRLYANAGFLGALRRVFADHQMVFLGAGMRERETGQVWQSIREKAGHGRFSGVFFAHSAYFEAQRVDDLRRQDVRVHVFEAPANDWSHLYAVADELATRIPRQKTMVPFSGLRVGPEEQHLLAKFLLVRTQPAEQDAAIQFFRAVALAGLCRLPPDEAHDASSMVSSIGARALPSTPAILAKVSQALRALESEGLVAQDRGRFRLKMEARRIVEATQNKTDDRLKEAAKIAVETTSHAVGPSVPKVALDNLLELASTVVTRHASTVAESVVRGVPIANDLDWLARAIEKAAAELRIDAPINVLCAALGRFLRPDSDELQSTVEHFVYSHLAATAFLVDPETEIVARSFAERHVVLLDASILLPLLAEGHPLHRPYARLLAASADLGMRLLVTEDILEEVASNLTNAIGLFQELDRKSLDAADAVRAYTSFVDPNTINPFLCGFAHVTAVHSTGWRRYLGDMVDGSGRQVAHSGLVRAIETWKVKVLKRGDEPELSDSGIQKLTDEILRQRRTRRGMSQRKHELLSRHEARQLVLVNTMRLKLDTPLPLVWFLTTDACLPKVQLERLDEYPVPLTTSPVRWEGYIQLVDARGLSIDVLSGLVSSVARSGLAEIVARRLVVALAQKRKEMNAEGVVTLTDLATKAITETHRSALEAEIARIDQTEENEQRHDEKLREAVGHAVEEAARPFVLTSREKLEELKQKDRTIAKLKYNQRQLRQRLTGRKNKKRSR